MGLVVLQRCFDNTLTLMVGHGREEKYYERLLTAGTDSHPGVELWRQVPTAVAHGMPRSLYCSPGKEWVWLWLPWEGLALAVGALRGTGCT